MLTLRQIEVFRAVIRAGTLVGAARELGIAQPTATRIIRRVEDVVGHPLFDRSGGRLTPTEEARRIMAEVDRAFAALRTAVDRAARGSRSEESVFHVGASPSVGRTLVPRALAALVRAHRALSVRLDILPVSQVVPYLTEGPGHAAVTLFPILQSGIHSVRAGDGPLVALVPRDFPLAARDLVRPDDLRGLPLAVFEAGAMHAEMLQAFLAQSGIAPGRTHQVRFAESAAALAETGIAVALVDRFSAMAVDRSRVAVLPTDATRRFEVYVHRVLDRIQGRFMTPFETALADLIARESMP